MLPTFFDFLFTADYTVWFQINSKNSITYTIFDKEECLDLEFERENFSFTKDLSEWKESNTLKYKDISIAEIQVHKNRTFKFRFIMSNIIKFLKEINKSNETFGITAEKTICDIFNLDAPSHMTHRSSIKIENKIRDYIKEAFKNLPRPIRYTGADQGIRKAESKCPYDFVLEGGKTLSLKTNTQNKVCPSEVGQPSSKTCYAYFKDLCDEDNINANSFKRMVYKNIDKMIPIYLSHLFDTDFLLWIYERKGKIYYKIFEKNYACNKIWEKSKFSFTKSNIEDWNESNTVKYNGVTIGEFQIHKNRDCYKFRFNLMNLVKIT